MLYKQTIRQKQKEIQMPRIAKINCGEGENTYQVTVTGKDPLTFNEAAIPADVKGEERVAALLAAGGVISIERRKNGKLNDGANGEAAWSTYNHSDILVTSKHYEDGE